MKENRKQSKKSFNDTNNFHDPVVRCVKSLAFSPALCSCPGTPTGSCVLRVYALRLGSAVGRKHGGIVGQTDGTFTKPFLCNKGLCWVEFL